ncbi:MAG TPA: DUF4244 domain-containing protein [Candidatus Avipropionibacterium avicola]|uniref:DUF4244 domain-containing protein n=1 Tax=Candidatus Avipropionibacterium avicola TaxID=2840701 RepID=A0A9D1KP24_9ACTN|nr:DUF4244 domain-containing protein [Candidatus Avipropionibacterium avicola]
MSASHEQQRVRDERGMTTAEYAVGTVATVTAAGVLITIFQQPWFQELLIKLIKLIIELVTGFSF